MYYIRNVTFNKASRRSHTLFSVSSFTSAPLLSSYYVLSYMLHLSLAISARGPFFLHKGQTCAVPAVTGFKTAPHYTLVTGIIRKNVSPSRE